MKAREDYDYEKIGQGDDDLLIVCPKCGDEYYLEEYTAQRKVTHVRSPYVSIYASPGSLEWQDDGPTTHDGGEDGKEEVFCHGCFATMTMEEFDNAYADAMDKWREIQDGK